MPSPTRVFQNQGFIMKFKNLLKSFKYAIRGIVFVYKNEQNFRLQFFSSLVVLFFTWYFPLSKGECVVIILLIFLVLILELFNTAVEKLIDVMKPRLSFQIEVVKDIMASVVLMSAIVSVLIGVIIFYPYFVVLISQKW